MTDKEKLAKAEKKLALACAMSDSFKAKADELETLFDIQHKRTVKADKLWRDAHPGSELIVPDLGAVIEWLLNRADEAERKLAVAAVVVEKMQKALKEIESNGYSGESADAGLDEARLVAREALAAISSPALAEREAVPPGEIARMLRLCTAVDVLTDPEGSLGAAGVNPGPERDEAEAALAEWVNNRGLEVPLLVEREAARTAVIAVIEEKYREYIHDGLCKGDDACSCSFVIQALNRLREVEGKEAGR